ncbi:hypothetical protein HAX54_004363, partial [Datura stramonium]|nr:hypothetical protein [Datura stramonium]
TYLGYRIVHRTYGNWVVPFEWDIRPAPKIQKSYTVVGGSSPKLPRFIRQPGASGEVRPFYHDSSHGVE